MRNRSLSWRVGRVGVFDRLDRNFKPQVLGLRPINKRLTMLRINTKFRKVCFMPQLKIKTKQWRIRSPNIPCLTCYIYFWTWKITPVLTIFLRTLPRKRGPMLDLSSNHGPWPLDLEKETSRVGLKMNTVSVHQGLSLTDALFLFASRCRTSKVLFDL